MKWTLTGIAVIGLLAFQAALPVVSHAASDHSIQSTPSENLTQGTNHAGKEFSTEAAGGFHHPAYWNKNSLLQQGDTGVEVKNMQYILNVMSYYTETGIVDVDGIFGPKTTKAVKKYQKANGLTADGIVGPKTWKSFSQFIEKKNKTTYGAGGYMGLRIQWKYDSTSDRSPCTVTVYGNGETQSDKYRLYPHS